MTKFQTQLEHIMTQLDFLTDDELLYVYERLLNKKKKIEKHRCLGCTSSKAHKAA